MFSDITSSRHFINEKKIYRELREKHERREARESCSKIKLRVIGEQRSVIAREKEWETDMAHIYVGVYMNVSEFPVYACV